MIPARSIAIAATCLALSGCWVASFDDVSSDSAYRSLIGKGLEAPNELLVFGVTRDRNYAMGVDACVLTPAPGFDGPAVVVRGRLPAGSSLTITGVERCTNCLFEERVELVVSTAAFAPCAGIPIRISRTHLGSAVVLKPVSQGAPNNSSKPTPLRGAA